MLFDANGFTPRDLIDTEHAEGDIYKMFLGSLCQEYDQKKRYSLDPSVTPTTPTSGRSEHYMNPEQTHQGGYTSPISSIPRSQTMNSAYADSQANFLSSSSQFPQSPIQRHVSPSQFPRDSSLTALGRNSTWDTYNSASSGGGVPEGLVSSSQEGSSSQTQRNYSTQHTHQWGGR